MTNIANDGTYELTQPGNAEPVGYLVAVGAMQHWVLGKHYTPPSEQNQQVALTFTRISALPYAEARVLELHRNLPGSRYIFVEVSDGAPSAAPAADLDVMAGTRSTPVTDDDPSPIVKAGRKQIDLGCFMVSQDDSTAGGVCVQGSAPAIEAWRLAKSDVDAAAGTKASGAAGPVKAFRLIGAAPTTLTFVYLDNGRSPRSQSHEQLDGQLARANASPLFAVCRDRSDSAAGESHAAQ